MQFQVDVNCSNESFAEYGFVFEIQRILKEIADKVENGQRSGILLDYNGNRVGEFGFRNVTTKGEL